MIAAAIVQIEAIRGPVPSVEFQIVDLPGNLLGVASGHTIQIDVNAAGYGWGVSRELIFAGQEPDRQLADWNHPSGPWAGPDDGPRVDLLTVVLHELGHVLGYGHADEGIMQDRLALGERRWWEAESDPWDDPYDVEDILAHEVLGAILVNG